MKPRREDRPVVTMVVRPCGHQVEIIDQSILRAHPLANGGQGLTVDLWLMPCTQCPGREG